MEMIISANGGWCHVEKCDSIICPECSCKSFTFSEGENWIGHDKREIFAIMVCEECGKKLDISLDLE